MTENQLSYEIIGAAIVVHQELGGPGLLEDVYEESLVYELGARGIKARRQVGFKIKYKGRELKKRLVIDVLVEDLVIVETKSVETYHPVFEAQLLTYLRQTNKRLGLVINFGAITIKESTESSTNSKIEASSTHQLCAFAPFAPLRQKKSASRIASEQHLEKALNQNRPANLNNEERTDATPKY